MSPLLIASTDTERHAVVLTVEGSFVDPAHTEVMHSTLAVLPTGFGLIIDLSESTEFSNETLDGLRQLARDASADEQTVVFVCADIDRHAELVLAALDTLAPVVETVEHALPLMRAAA